MNRSDITCIVRVSHFIYSFCFTHIQSHTHTQFVFYFHSVSALFPFLFLLSSLSQSVSVNYKTAVRQDAEFILSCEAQGSPKMIFRWYKNGIYINTTKATRCVLTSQGKVSQTQAHTHTDEDGEKAKPQFDFIHLAVEKFFPPAHHTTSHMGFHIRIQFAAIFSFCLRQLSVHILPWLDDSTTLRERWDASSWEIYAAVVWGYDKNTSKFFSCGNSFPAFWILILRNTSHRVPSLLISTAIVSVCVSVCE